MDYSEVINILRCFYRAPDAQSARCHDSAKAMSAMRLAYALIEFVIAGPRKLNNDKFVMRPFSLWGHFRCALKMVRPATDKRDSSQRHPRQARNESRMSELTSLLAHDVIRKSRAPYSTPRFSQSPYEPPSGVFHSMRPLHERPRAMAPAEDGEPNGTSRVSTPTPPSTAIEPSATSRSC